MAETVDDFAPLSGMKTVPQQTQFAIDPSLGLTRERYGWYSNGTLFDNTNVSDVEGAIRLATTATGSDTVRLRSAFAGQYISHTLGQPGLGLGVDASNISVSNGQSSLSHGDLWFGAFIWDDANGGPLTGIGHHLDTNGWEFFIRSNGSHVGDSPFPQGDWDDSVDYRGSSGLLVTPDEFIVANYPYTWYNGGASGAGLLDTDNDRLTKTISRDVEGRPATETANLPVQTALDNGGTATAMGVEVGGMQFTTYGAGLDRVTRRRTPVTRYTTGGTITTPAATTNGQLDQAAEPGIPMLSVKRVVDRLEVRSAAIGGFVSSNDVLLYIWDEWDPATALTGASFGAGEQEVATNPAESQVEVDTAASDYTPTQAVLRDVIPLAGGTNSGSNKGPVLSDTGADLRLPIEATRVVTAVTADDTADADVMPLKFAIEEGF